jgi:hypothetical protein
LDAGRAVDDAQRVVDLDDLTAAQVCPREPVGLSTQVAFFLIFDQPAGLLEGDPLRKNLVISGGGRSLLRSGLGRHQRQEQEEFPSWEEALRSPHCRMVRWLLSALSSIDRLHSRIPPSLYLERHPCPRRAGGADKSLVFSGRAS